jgi:hypothetical protein
MSDAENIHICGSKMVFEVYKCYMLMLLIKRKNHLEISHNVFFSTFTQTRGSKGGIQLHGRILKGIFTNNKIENEKKFR